MFFDKYSEKKDGVIRSFDVKSPKVKILCAIIMLICIIMVVICLFPAVWVFLASFKDIKEFTRNVSIFPDKLDFDGLKKTWDALKFAKRYNISNPKKWEERSLLMPFVWIGKSEWVKKGKDKKNFSIFFDACLKSP